MPEQLTSPNFSFLAVHDAQLVRLGALAERYFKEDPATCLIKLRQYGETLAQLVAAKAGLFRDAQEPQADLLRRLKFDKVIPREVGELFHHLRTLGNKATHDNQGNHAEALTALKVGRELGIWFHRTFGAGKSFSPGAFVPPPDPTAATQALTGELARLRIELDSHRTAAEKALATAEEKERARLSADQQAQREREDRVVWEQLAAEAEQANAALAAQLQSLQAVAAQAPAAQLTTAIAAKAEEAAAEINIDEASTRALIDEQLRARGWEVDTQSIRYSAGSRPAKGRNLAIAEWPTTSGPADWVRTGSHGSFWVDPKTLDTRRLEMYADDLPTDFANTSAATWIEYGRFQLGSRNVLLPQTAGLLLDERSGKRNLIRNLNLFSFSHCQQYSAESSISFENAHKLDVNRSPSTLSARAALKGSEFPNGLVLHLRLSTSIDSSTTAVGDRLSAICTSDVSYRGRVAVPSGAIVHGRVRRMEMREGPPRQYAVGLEISEVVVNGQRIPFFGSLERLEPTMKGLVKIDGVGPVEYQSSPDAITEIYNAQGIPGVATLIILGKDDFTVPAGTTMIWRTRKVKWGPPKTSNPTNWAPGPSPTPQ